MSIGKASFSAPASRRAQWESALEERLLEAGFVVSSRETSRDGPWQIEVVGESEEAEVAAAIREAAQALGLEPPSWHWEILPDKDWVAKVKEYDPHVIAMSYTTGLHSYMMDLTKAVKQHSMPPLAMLSGDQCGGCRMSLPSAVLRSVRSGKPVECESCGRILYMVE